MSHRQTYRTRDTSQAEWNAAHYEKECSFVWKYGEELIALLAPRAGERILDLGCGTGQLSAVIAQSGAAVTGIDSSAEMIERARVNYPALRFEVADASQFRSSEPFDAVFSNAALHWMTEAGDVASTIAVALRPGGRFVAELGGKGNIESLLRESTAVWLDVAGTAHEPALNPWYFPSVGQYANLLEGRGLEVRYAALFDRPTPLEGGFGALREWMNMFLNTALQRMQPKIREAFLSQLEERIRPRLFRSDRWMLDYRRLRIMAVKTA